jgi:hypothetical protein
MTESATPATPRRRHRALIAGLTGAVLVAGGVATYTWTRPSTKAQHVAAPARVAAARPTTPAPVVTPPPKPTVAHDYVAPAVPTSFKITGRGFSVKAHVCAMPAVFPLDPPGDQRHTVCWVKKGFGVKPGSNSGTSYILGHSWAEDAQEVLNKVSEPATREVLDGKSTRLDGVPVFPAKSLIGAKITLTTPTGTLTYAVRDAYGVDKLKLGLIKPVMNQQIRNRVLLITCAELHGRDYEYNIVLSAYLVSSKRATRPV